jgi:two-component system chemotaxis response regulator CheB
MAAGDDKRKIRVLVVDDSPTFRAALSLALESDPDIVIAGQAGDGMQALEMLRRVKPDVVTMDVMMPVLDGLEASQRMLAEQPLPIVLMSTLARSHEQRMALNALRLGVVEVINKPVLAGPGGRAGIAAVSKLVRAAASVRVGPSVARHAPKPAAEARPSGAVDLIAIAASTGGPPALEKLLAALPRKFPPIVVAQHLAPSFSRGFADWLQSATSREVEMVEGRRPLRRSCIFVPGENQHLRVRLGEVEAVAAGEGELAPNADVLFRSLARYYGAGCVGVVLTGMGDDGAEGLKLMLQAGSWTIAQDRETSVVYGMPRAAVEARACKEVLPLNEIAVRLRELLEAAP